ncbi:MULTISPECIES: DUF3955 domain-containing protein [unclassified Fusibacter]|uniref:DUF3955 domain-containing protein n=1 Tax=unclassified Fusibacter TaxID=2624464 RepID=UPI0010139964|nr:MULTISPECIES: DUF3955 domain-containing protein [unclassified Fusibacter]MCK8058532.1 DUF3955 domain-containing protein [Fusibacter sp. A2]NPE22699.1 DUF3955 domain-containing protein [Fusibacter sp. A1]RXV60259.1 DUF3955 domain-containing protein [Fusibacter sp. A1]
MKKYHVSLLALVLAASCIIMFNLIGSSVNEEGILIEPFFLIPIGYICLLIAVVSAVFTRISTRRSARG